MIEELHGTKEVVNHYMSSGFRLYINDESENYPPHWHSDLEIVMPLESWYKINLNKTDYALSEGDIIIIPQGELHSLSAPPQGKRIIFQVNQEVLHEVNGFDSISSSFFPCAIFRNGDEGNEELRNLLEQIVVEYQETAPLFAASIHALAVQFFVKAARIRFQHPEELGSSFSMQRQQVYMDTFFDVCSYINDHCTENLTIDQLAEMTDFSKSHFIRLFKEFTGVTCYDYLQKRRIVYAELMLSNPQYSITEVAMSSGFNSLATFNRVFRSAHDCTPTEYRKQIHKVSTPFEVK